MLTLDQYQRAEVELHSARARRGFKIHATIVVVVMIGQVVLNVVLIAFTDAKFPWVVFPLLGWGIGLACNYRAVRRHPGRYIRARQTMVERHAIREGSLL